MIRSISELSYDYGCTEAAATNGVKFYCTMIRALYVDSMGDEARPKTITAANILLDELDSRQMFGIAYGTNILTSLIKLTDVQNLDTIGMSDEVLADHLMSIAARLEKLPKRELLYNDLDQYRTL